jgi:hypothetical protein
VALWTAAESVDSAFRSFPVCSTVCGVSHLHILRYSKHVLRTGANHWSAALLKCLRV